MSQLYGPSWDPCKVFGYENAGRKTSEKFTGNSVPFEDKPRVKTIAKAIRKELPAVKATWKSFLPELSAKDVRRYRIPHHEVVILELEELGYDYAAQYLKMLFAMDEETRMKTGPGTVIWSNPRLKDHADFVDRLKNGLIEANKAMIREQWMAQVAAFLEMALYFQETDWEWSWISEQLFRSSLSISETIEDDDCQTITMIKYLYGRFLFEKMKDTEEALKLLDEACEASQERLWNATKIVGNKQESVFRECSTLLYRALVSMGKNAREDNADLAVEVCQKALKHAIDSDHDGYVTDAMCELGRSYLQAKQPKLALQNFVRYLNLSRKIMDYEGICNAHMELAFAYKELGETDKTVEHLELFRETASRFQLPYNLAKAHYHIGEHLLSQNQLAEATSHLEFAFTLYNGMGQTVEANQARCIAAVSKGQEVIDQFIDLILRCGRYDQTATLKLCDWKNDRVPFWKMNNMDETCDEGEDKTFELRKSKSESYSLATVYESSTQSEIFELERVISLDPMKPTENHD